MFFQKIKMLAQTARIRCKVKDRDRYLWIFSSTGNRSFNYNSKYLFLYVKDHYPMIKPRFVINDDDLRGELAERYGAEYFIDTRTKEGMRMAFGAGVWFTSAGLPVYGRHLNENRRIINLWHGIPLKKIVLDDRETGFLSKLYHRRFARENITDLLAESSAYVPVMAGAFGVPEERVRIWGQPRNDLLFEDFLREEYLGKRLHDLPEYDRVILYAPTFRKDEAVRLFPFEDDDRKAWEDFFEEHRILMLIRTHAFEKEVQSKYVSPHVRFFNENLEEDITHILPGIDLLMTDYSSIYLDYLLLDRPMLFLPYDLADYEKKHGFYMPYDTCTPGPKPETMRACMEEILAALTKDAYAEERGALRAKMHEADYPCMERICRDVLES